ncbi:MAG: class I SAM-dependent methyltransferase [Hyphomonadaceae bacterium]|nr:class I SAM-dependent methyltransferase [Hyphomonadaceae bacterium]
MSERASNAGYADEAPDLLQRYESFAPEEVHAHWRQWFPKPPRRVLDIGAGTGRDAAWLASLGHSVLAVEPTDALRHGAQALHPEPGITWLSDLLPGLPNVVALNQRFDLILINAVWMHLTEAERRTAFATVAGLMASGARLFISQRHGPIPEGRRMFDVTGAETIAFATRYGLKTLYHERKGSIMAESTRRGVEWTCLVFEKS